MHGLMRRVVLSAALSALLCSAAPAFADRAPDASKVKAAAEQFDGGVAALKARDFESAASHFEAADAAVPSGQALRQAIKARQEAGQGSRAATLAALAIQRYPTDTVTVRLAREALEKVTPLLGKVNVSCASPCVLAVGTRGVVGEANTRWTVYLDPGHATLSASFFGGGSAQKELDPTAGSSIDIRFEPEDKSAAAAGAVALPAAAGAGDTPPVDQTTDQQPAKGLPKAIFFTGLVATAALGGVTIWSGIDTVKNPGADAVKAACAGKGTSCALYEQGRSKQTRTNVFVGATAGAGAVTIVLAIFTKWKSTPKPADNAPTDATPTAFVFDRGAGLGARGSF
jgi:hypothetical protein